MGNGEQGTGKGMESGTVKRGGMNEKSGNGEQGKIGNDAGGNVDMH